MYQVETLNYSTNISWIAIRYEKLCQALRIQNKNIIVQDLKFSFEKEKFIDLSLYKLVICSYMVQPSSTAFYKYTEKRMGYLSDNAYRQWKQLITEITDIFNNSRITKYTEL